MYDNATKKYQISDNGECFLNVEDIEETPQSIKSYIPKLMPNIPLGDCAVSNIKLPINLSIFQNSKDCAITGIRQILNCQNYLTIKPYDNQHPNFRKKAIEKNGKLVVEKHNKFILEVLHGDIGNMHFTDKL